MSNIPLISVFLFVTFQESTDENMSSVTPTTPCPFPILYSDQDSAEESTPDSEEEYLPDIEDEEGGCIEDAFAQPVVGVNQMLWKVISVMTQDDITDTIKRDPSILMMGEHLYNKVGSDPSKHQYIRQKLREVGRLLLYSKEVGHLKTMSDFIIPANFPHVVSAVRHVSGFSAEKNNFCIPSLALKLGHSLKIIANIIECEAMKKGERECVQNAQTFKQIYDTKWNECISSSALRTLTDAKYNAPQFLPFTDDVRKLHLYLDDKQKENVRKLSAVVSQKNWASLAKGTLAQIILFNRRPQGEVSKMPLTAFTSRDASSMHPDVEEAPNEVEKKLCGHFQRVEIRGKCGRKVAILLTPPMVQSMELLVETRSSCFPVENQYMFGRPGTQSHFKGSDCIQIFAQHCGAKHPEWLSSTKLRKHIATMSKVLNLTDTDMDLLVQFLGHDIHVHKKFYRLPEGTLELAKTTKILTALETGRLADFKGRNLDEINIDPNETLDVITGFADEDCSDTDPTTSQPGANNTNKDSPSTSARDETPQTLDVTTGFPDEDCSDTDPTPSQPGANNTNKDSPSTSARDETPQTLDVTSTTGFPDEDCSDTDPTPSQPGANNTNKDSPSTSARDETPQTGPSTSPKRRWTHEEVAAVEAKFMNLIKAGRTPGKRQCIECIQAAPKALQNRDWTAIKYYVKNRIASYQRVASKRVT
ncbi:uncharacterized protein LOC134452758 isoform X2 [Engraulis encrasicolus]|uniref:uncharacterized protein LOC134452758 isoform X2 n=1 Tax=Engraulis encrasicolus TaxID=184585 RepID=UPI002FCFFD8B